MAGRRCAPAAQRLTPAAQGAESSTQQRADPARCPSSSTSRCSPPIRCTAPYASCKRLQTCPSRRITITFGVANHDGDFNGINAVTVWHIVGADCALSSAAGIRPARAGRSFGHRTLAGRGGTARRTAHAHDLSPGEAAEASPLPLFVWGNGACRDNGLAHGAFLRQIASQGYFVVALGRPREERPFNPDRRLPCAAAATAPAAAARRRAAAQHAGRNPGRADARGHRLGHARERARGQRVRRATSIFRASRSAATAAADCRRWPCRMIRASTPRWCSTAASMCARDGARSGVQHRQVAAGEAARPDAVPGGGPADIAHPNASDDVARIGHVPVFFGALPVGHGGTFWTQRDGGDWARVATRWLDWHAEGRRGCELGFRRSRLPAVHRPALDRGAEADARCRRGRSANRCTCRCATARGWR